MGRRPNALVSEYFARGAKCSDTSNRYSHTCKRCGENFPKGRVDSLMSHLLRRCSHTSQLERTFIYRSIQQQNPTAPSREDENPPSTGLADNGKESEVQGETLSPVLHQVQQQSALDTLAEVSRRQLDISAHVQSRQDVEVEPKTPEVDQQNPYGQLYSQLREAVDAAPAAPNAEDAQSSTFHASTLNTSSAAPLVETASAATEQLEQIVRQDNLDPALESHDAHRREELDSHKPSEADSTHTSPPGISQFISRPIGFTSLPADDDHEPMSWVSSNGPIELYPSSHSLRNIMAKAKKPMSFLPKDGVTVAHTFPSSLSDAMAASNQPMSGFGPLRNDTKVRSRFSDDRRKEVQETRKRGACIRCRMLKKPCSEGTPCNACKVVGSARLWKGSCLRTRLADEFTLWSAALFTNRAQSAVAGASQGLEDISIDAAIEVRLSSGSDSYISLPARRYNQNNLARQQNARNAYGGDDPDLVLRAQFEAHMESPPVYLLEEDAVVSSKLEEHIGRLFDCHIDHEPSHFLKATLQHAQTLLREEESEATTSDPLSTNSARTSYTFQHQLLRNVVELWILTRILTRKDDSEIHIRLPPEESHPELLPQNIPILRAQILSSLESRSATLGKSITNELERRLLQRQQVSRFGTFIASVLLLNCIERMAEFFHEIETNDRETESPPLWPQGSHFADLLIMLLRMRGLPPKTKADSQGKLVVAIPSTNENPARPVSATKKAEREALELATEWLNPLKLDYEALVRTSDDEHREGTWDMRFVCRALLSVDGVRK
ncbi:uncharacterized protein RCC_08366 [Ramularia collo-cygni]|uniref:Uncharacterized protein n=1 Tax=Ramularia collo-cygni TaxID=112498 RepID=A0A2D3VF24_9PEZI|nr:uncharacterized protein RCC_08366 [Ramularia collo-cygni]CZT22661.1 uncharacterized protein RCC_08366 [Ramularia collo-cygni]